MPHVQREYPQAPLIAVGAVIVNDDRMLLVRRAREPLKGRWTLPGGLLDLGESIVEGVAREVLEETGLVVSPIALVELIDRIVYDTESATKTAAGFETSAETGRVRYHYVIADYLCRVTGGELCAASDADAVRWVERGEWNRDRDLDAVTVRVLEKGWQMAQAFDSASPPLRDSGHGIQRKA